jgi:tripartite-type tricarboxylate transporter receptor subunit TctC
MSDRTAGTAHRRSLATAVLLTAVLCAPTPYARADDYPSRAITLIVPYPAGGGVDAMARLVASKLSAPLGQQVIVDNRGGAGGRTRAVNRVPACGM